MNTARCAAFHWQYRCTRDAGHHDQHHFLFDSGEVHLAHNCSCHACWERDTVDMTEWDRTLARRFIVCETCGNKRCPKASDHRLDCTKSNAPGQKGSIYG
jgi:hypothetical protein